MTKKNIVNSVLDDKGIATITINKPEIHNAFDDELILQLSEDISNFSDNEDVRIIILTASGKSFCAGADLNWMKKMATYAYNTNLNDAKKASKLFTNIAFSKKMIVAKINGNAFGGGVGIIAACDLAVSIDTAIFSLSEVRLGLIPSMISPYVIRAIGRRQASRYMLTGERFNAKTAKQLGLLHEVVPSDEIEDFMDSLIDEVLLSGPKALSACKELIRTVEGHPLNEELVEITAKKIAAIRGSSEANSGLQAFFEKEKPPWALTDKG